MNFSQLVRISFNIFQGFGTIFIANSFTLKAIVIKTLRKSKKRFFSKHVGRKFDARLRHGNLKYKDDASSDVRSFSIKFADDDSESPLDIVMNTGEANVFWNVASFNDFVPVNEGETAKEYVYKNPYQ